MTNDALGPGERTKVRRLPGKARYDRDTVLGILDEVRMCHVAAIVDGKPVAMPTIHAREGNTLYLHGSQSSAFMKALVSAGEAFITATLYDGLRLARSGFESSIAYRSVVVVGRASAVEDFAEKQRVLDMFVDAILPGRASEVRPMTEREINLTLVVAVSLDEASAKLSAGPTEDFPEDLPLPIWAGTIPARLEFGEPIPATDGAMADQEIPLPASVRRLLQQ
jgi:nitroimidazol reductase NimA-like FMN-containing flavoprotein (pyridoxamine 5'-phosphate oxidase superfamily)